MASTLVIGLTASGCAPPLQSGGVEIRAGAIDRLAMVCRWQRAGSAQGSMCEAMDPDVEIAPPVGAISPVVPNESPPAPTGVLEAPGAVRASSTIGAGATGMNNRQEVKVQTGALTEGTRHR